MTPTPQVSDRRARVGATLVGVVHIFLAVIVVALSYVSAKHGADGDQRSAQVIWYAVLAVACAATLVTIGVALLRSRRAAPPLLAALTRTTRRSYWVAGGLVAAAIVGTALGALLSFPVAMPVAMSLGSAPASLWYLKHFAATRSEHLRPPDAPKAV